VRLLLDGEELAAVAALQQLVPVQLVVLEELLGRVVVGAKGNVDEAVGVAVATAELVHPGLGVSFAEVLPQHVGGVAQHEAREHRASVPVTQTKISIINGTIFIFLEEKWLSR
jgi:hypothetical protein